MTSRPDDPSRTVPIEAASMLGKAVRERMLAERKPFLVAVAGDDVGMRWRLGGSCVLGRDPACEITLRDAGVSWRHARLDVKAQEVWLVDLESTNGTRVEAVTVTGARLLATGEKIFLGATVLRLDWLDALDQEFQDELERLIHIDELTGLLSKRRFDSDGAILVQGCLARRENVTVLMMDLDGVKKINDANGHAFGAHVIAESGAIIGRVIGTRGLATRWGGDEFSAVLPALGAAEGRAIAEEILAAIRAHAYEREGIRLHPGISIGVATGPECGETLESLQRWADEALYRAKRAGRGRVSD